MEDSSGIIRELQQSGCGKKEAVRIGKCCAEGHHGEALLQMRRIRGILLEDLHERQRCVDRIDSLIREQERQIKERNEKK